MGHRGLEERGERGRTENGRYRECMYVSEDQVQDVHLWMDGWTDGWTDGIGMGFGGRGEGRGWDWGL